VRPRAKPQTPCFVNCGVAPHHGIGCFGRETVGGMMFFGSEGVKEIPWFQRVGGERMKKRKGGLSLLTVPKR
jgi:hypothetical protein